MVLVLDETLSENICDIMKDQCLHVDHITAEQPKSNLMCTGVRSKEKTFTDIKVVRLFPADVIFGNEQGIKVLMRCDHWVQLTVDREERVASW